MNQRTFGPFVVLTGGLAFALFIGLSLDELRQLWSSGASGHLFRAVGYFGAFLLLGAASAAFWSGFRAEGRTAHELAVRAEAEREVVDRLAERRDAVRALMVPGGMHMVFQPITSFDTGQVHGYEALARFPVHGPDFWFPEAGHVGLLKELELHAIALGLEGLDHTRSDQYISVNLSAQTLLDPALLDLIGFDAGPRVVIELTEHTPVEVYADVVAALTVLRFRGVRLAIDDFGTGYGSLNHVVLLSADLVKIDRSLVSGIADDPILTSLVAAMVAFTAAMGISLLAEGVETSSEATCLRNLGVELAQGWLFGRPGDLRSIPRHASAGELSTAPRGRGPGPLPSFLSVNPPWKSLASPAGGVRSSTIWEVPRQSPPP
ncbi:EAL domain-containing protein [Pengzhenrongella phosphoraccumulans]|uniref:EAL domain-containing protein n=1 Tax=Pengzhenrongella phosphoraccumulans TaxID=3114394 RepID=UPI00388D6C4B